MRLPHIQSPPFTGTRRSERTASNTPAAATALSPSFARNPPLALHALRDLSRQSGVIGQPAHPTSEFVPPAPPSTPPTTSTQQSRTKPTTLHDLEATRLELRHSANATVRDFERRMQALQIAWTSRSLDADAFRRIANEIVEALADRAHEIPEWAYVQLNDDIALQHAKFGESQRADAGVLQSVRDAMERGVPLHELIVMWEVNNPADIADLQAFEVSLASGHLAAAAGISRDR